MKYLYQHPINGRNRKIRRAAAALARRYPKSVSAVAFNKECQSAPFMTPAVRIVSGGFMSDPVYIGR